MPLNLTVPRGDMQPGNLLAEHNMSQCVRAMRLKSLLRDVQTDCANLCHGRLLQVVSLTPPLWHLDAVGGRPPHQYTVPLRRTALQRYADDGTPAADAGHSEHLATAQW